MIFLKRMSVIFNKFFGFDIFQIFLCTKHVYVCTNTYKT